MRSQAKQYVTAGALVLVGLIMGFQVSKSQMNAQAAGPMVSTAQASGTTATQPIDYFPAHYVNQAKFSEPLPAQF